MARNDGKEFRIDLDRVVSDSSYRREILRRLAGAGRPPRYRPGAQGKRELLPGTPPRPPRAGRSAGDRGPGGSPG